MPGRVSRGRVAPVNALLMLKRGNRQWYLLEASIPYAVVRLRRMTFQTMGLPAAFHKGAMRIIGVNQDTDHVL